jgi:hypothetical protein
VPLIVVTRLRLRDADQLNDFFTAAVAVLDQSKASDGSLGADVLADANNAWWTVTAWQDRERMDAFVAANPHVETMHHLDTWCDQATFVDWDQDSADLPDWQTSYQRLIADGQVAELTNADPGHATRDFPPPVVPAT